MIPKLAPPRFHYGWIVVAVTALTLILSAGVRSAPGVLIHPLEVEFGWSRATISFAVSLGLVLFGLVGPLVGWLVDRRGPRVAMLGGLALIVISMVATSMMMDLWQLNLFWGVLSGVGTGAVAAVLGATVANRWFSARRGLVVGIFGAATSAGQLIFIPLLMLLVVAIGWRGSVVLLAAAAALMLVPVFFLMRNDPADVGLTPYGGTGEQPANGAESRPEQRGGIMKRAVRTSEFWLLSGSFFICGATSNGLIGTHLIPYAIDHGVAAVSAAGILGVMGVMNFVGTIGSGYLTDRYSPRKLLAIYYGFRGLSLLLLPFVTDVTGMAVFAVLFGLDYIATVPPTVALVADHFGRRHVGVVFGWVFCSHQFGAAMAAWLGGLVRDATGDYGAAFLAAGFLAMIAALLALRIGSGRLVPVNA